MNPAASRTRRVGAAIFAAYRRVPVRWRLGGGSAALTFVILAIFAVAVGVLTDREVNDQFNNDLSSNVETLAAHLSPVAYGKHDRLNCTNNIPDLGEFAPGEQPQIRVLNIIGRPECTQLNVAGAAISAKALAKLPVFSVPPQTQAPYVQNGFRIEARTISWKWHKIPQSGYVLFARPISSINQEIGEIHVWLTLGVLGGAIMALLAGLLVADRAMRPIAELTDVAREIERTRNPDLSIPHPVANDEVAELARTLEGMLGALSDARNEAISALSRQREFVADASHELRTPLTSVLANLELLADELDGEQADSAKSALRATQRMRRLVGDLLLLARADIERQKTRVTVDLGESLTDVAAELGPVAERHDLSITLKPAPVFGLKDDLHRLILNLIENALHHTPAGTRIHAATLTDPNGSPVLIVEDDGPGISPELQDKVFERFVRGGGDSSGRGTGLGLAIVSAVAGAHGATVSLISLPEISGTRFEIRFPAEAPGTAAAARAGDPRAEAQTTTITGSTIGRRRSRS